MPERSRKCPYCAEEIRAEAIRCPFCRSRLGASDREHCGVVHLGTIAAIGPFGKCRTAHPACRAGLPAYQ